MYFLQRIVNLFLLFFLFVYVFPFTLHSQVKLPVNHKTNQINENIKNIKAYITKLGKDGKFSGSALVAKNGKILLHQTYGYADKSFKVLNKPDTKFNLGSLNKSFTAVAILQLVQEGKIGIDDPIGKYLDYFPKDIADKVTIRQLLNMSSGWGDYWNNEYFLQHKDELRNVRQYMKFIKGIGLNFSPGLHMQHSNIGFEVAGAVIEKVSGIDYFDYIREKIYKPAGMKNSDSFDRDGPTDNLALGYTNINDADKNKTGFNWENTYLLSPKGTPSGGGYSTVEDMLKFDDALRNGKLISKDYFNFMNNDFKGKIGDPFTAGKILRNAGAAPGVAAFYACDMKNGFTIIVLSNYDPPEGIKIGNEIIKMLELQK